MTYILVVSEYCFFHNILQDKWECEHNRQQSNLEKKYQENLAEFGLGHKTASEVQYCDP